MLHRSLDCPSGVQIQSTQVYISLKFHKRIYKIVAVSLHNLFMYELVFKFFLSLVFLTQYNTDNIPICCSAHLKNAPDGFPSGILNNC